MEKNIKSSQIEYLDKKLDAEKFTENFEKLSSQLWNKELKDITVKDKLIFSLFEFFGGFVMDILGRGLQDIKIENHEAFLNLIKKEKRNGRGLLTVANHIHYIDDPLLLVALMKGSYLSAFKALWGNFEAFDNFKWTAAAKENFFYHPNPYIKKFFRWFFGYGKLVAISRLQGLDQLGQLQLIKKLNEGEWIHTFPEGGRTRKEGEIRPFKGGVGHLLKNAPDTIILPWAHTGIQYAYPFGLAFKVNNPKTGKQMKGLFRIKKRIQIVVGEPFTLKELAENVPYSFEGFNAINERLQKEVGICFDRAKELYRHYEMT